MLKQLLGLVALSAFMAAPVLAQEVHSPGNGVIPPTVVKEVHPTERGQGSVIVDCVVLADGTVGEVSVQRSAEKRLDDAAVDAVKQWTFEPGTRGGTPVAVRIYIQLNFRPR